jgi:dUTP pyrophosphatase
MAEIKQEYNWEEILQNAEIIQGILLKIHISSGDTSIASLFPTGILEDNVFTVYLNDITDIIYKYRNEGNLISRLYSLLPIHFLYDTKKGVSAKLNTIRKMQHPKLYVKRLNENAKLPSKKHATDLGYDITITNLRKSHPKYYQYSTGLSVCPPPGWALILAPRSGIYKTSAEGALANTVGIIDNSYRGEMIAIFRKNSPDEPPIDPTDYGNILQMFPILSPHFDIEEVDDLPTSLRGSGGFGSTGSADR